MNEGAIKDLLDTGLISEQYEVPFVTNPLSVSVNSSSKRRLILDLREFNVLPFGLTSTPYIFTTLTRPLIKKWRSEGKTILMYLDDGFGCHCEYEKACEMSRQVHADVVSSGFIPKKEKSMWVPCQIIEFLGIYLNFEQGTFNVPTRRLDKVSDTIQKIQYCISKSTRKVKAYS